MKTSTLTQRSTRVWAGIASVAVAAAVGVPAANAAPTAAPANAPAASSLAAAVTASSTSTPWAWANGTALKATSVSLNTAKVTNAANGGHSSMTWNFDWEVSDVTTAGRLIGLDGTTPMTSGGNFGKRLFSTPLKAQVLWAHGTTAYALSTSNVLYRSAGVGKPAVRVGTLSNVQDTQHPAIAGGRVYWTQQTGTGAIKSARVVSMPLAGGKLRVEANNARNPQATEAGIIVSTVKPARVVAGMLPITGLAKLNGKGTSPLLRFTKGALTPSNGLDYSIVASGRTITIANGAKSGMLVIDLRSKRAWNLQNPSGTTAYGQAVTGSTVSYTPFKAGAHLDWRATLKRVYSFNSATGSLTALATSAPTMNVSANGNFVAWQDYDHDGFPFAVSYRR